MYVIRLRLFLGIIEYTKSKSNDCVIETMRILGNLSRSKITRNYIGETEIFDTLVNLLNTGSRTKTRFRAPILPKYLF